MQHGSLPGGFLDALVAELDDPGLSGIILGGSHARGDASEYSDVDLALFLANQHERRQKRLFYRDGRLVSASFKAVEVVRANIREPEAAIWTVPGLRPSIILLDKDGSIATLMKELAEFRWEPLQGAASSSASLDMGLAVEQVHKVLKETARGNMPGLSYACDKLVSSLTRVVAVQRGVMVLSDSTYYGQVQEAAGPAWARYHNLATGVEIAPAGTSPLLARAAAVLGLYAETLDLLRPHMRAEHLQVAEDAVRLMERARASLMLTRAETTRAL